MLRAHLGLFSDTQIMDMLQVLMLKNALASISLASTSCDFKALVRIPRDPNVRTCCRCCCPLTNDGHKVTSCLLLRSPSDAQDDMLSALFCCLKRSSRC
eukprot:scaffold55356_cov26-Tisochrysis_lutea.AAC.1